MLIIFFKKLFYIMKLTKKIVNKIESVLYENEIDISKEASFFLSHIDNDLFCIFTRKNNNESFFSDKSKPNLNPFFKGVANMLLTDSLNLDGCFDYEHVMKSEYKTIKDKANNYFKTSLNFILVKYKKSKIIPVSFFTYLNGYIWNVCTDKNYRENGFMTILFKHFLTLIKLGEFDDDIKLTDNNLSLNLLKNNPNFDKTKQFYIDCGFYTRDDLSDKIIMVLNLNK